MSRIVFALVISLVLPGMANSASEPHRKVDKDWVKSIEKGLKKTQITLRGSGYRNPKTYYEADGEQFYYEHSRRYPGIFRIKKDEPVQVTGVKVRDDGVSIMFTSDRLGRGEVLFSSPLHSPVVNRTSFDEGFQKCFSDGSGKSADWVGNKKSMRYHASGSNHLPEAESREQFQTEDDAAAKGYDKCKLCFMSVPLVSEYSRERVLGLYVSQQLKAMGQLSTNDELTNRANEIGNRVLTNWPVPLQGYDYKFFVMEDSEINAYAVPTGFVYVNRGLLEMAESELEVEGVIAHEIAHVERRHSYRIYKNEEKKKAISAGIGILVGVVTGVKSDKNKAENAVIWGTLAASVAQSVANSVYEDYPRSMEEEADAMAALYLQGKHGQEGLDEMVTALRKLRYYGDYLGSEQKKLTAFRSHPLLDDRIATFQGSEVTIFVKPIRIVGSNGDGDDVVVMELSCQRQTSEAVAGRYSLDPTQILGHVTATADIKKPRKFKDIKLETVGGKKIKLDNKEDSLIGPYEDQGFLLRGKLDEPLDQIKISKVSVTLPKSGLKWRVEDN
jgi:Zn-dependent protease with chaperone function